MADSSAKTKAELPPDQELDDRAEAFEASAAPPSPEAAGASDLSPPPNPGEDKSATGPEEVNTPAEPEAKPALSRKRKILLAAAGLVLMSLALILALVLPFGGSEEADHKETTELARTLAPVVRAESLDQDRLARAEQSLGELKPGSPAARELAAGAAAFLKDQLGEAHQRFAAAAVLAPEIPELISFQAAASLRQGNSALAGDLYQRALSLKERAGYPPLDLASDQLGLALSLFFLQRPAEALPLAESAWQTRSRELGLDDPETLSAANRLATIQVALGRPEVAEELLKIAYKGALAGEDVEAALEETRLLLTVLYNQSGRLEELEDFFKEEPPVPAAGAGAEAKAVPVVEPAPTAPAPGVARPEPAEPPLPPATAENLAEWATIAAGLDQSNPELAAALRLRIIQGREVWLGRGRHQPELRADLLALAQAYLAAGQYNRALKELRPLEEGLDRESEEFVQYSDLLGQSLAGQGNFKEAESHWQAAADLVDSRISARIKAKKAPDPQDAAHSLDLHLKLADIFLKQGRVPQEAEIELRAALGRLGSKNADNYPETPRIYLRLARLMWETGRTGDSADYYRRAQTLAEALIPQADPAQQKFLANTARLAGLEAEALAAKQTRPVFKSELAPDQSESELPSPDVLRLELSALAALGRRGEFQARLEPILQEAGRRYGQLSQYYMRYYSLKLKGLEEDGRIDELTAELLEQADNPPGRNEAEQALNRGSALIYAARVNEKAGRSDEAVKLYQQALEAISGREEDLIAARRRAVEEALERLKN